jgi:hypothetical protein
MEFLNKIRLQIGKFILNRKLKNSSREKKVVNLDKARSIVLVYNVTDEKKFNIIKSISGDLSNDNRQVHVMGYVDSKSIPDYCVAANAGYYFSRNEINWYGGPKTDYLHQFVKKPFDILIDLTTEDTLITKYIAGLSNSKFKTGSFSKESQQYLDMMIEADPRESFENYLEQTLHYLKIIKSE